LNSRLERKAKAKGYAKNPAILVVRSSARGACEVPHFHLQEFQIGKIARSNEAAQRDFESRAGPFSRPARKALRYHRSELSVVSEETRIKHKSN
jgi:hypothetical protein